MLLLHCFELHTTVTAQNLSLVLCTDLIDSWDESTHGIIERNSFNLSTLLRQSVSSSGDFVPLDWFSETHCLLTSRNNSALLVVSESLSAFQGTVLHLIKLLRQHVFAWNDKKFFQLFFSSNHLLALKKVDLIDNSVHVYMNHTFSIWSCETVYSVTVVWIGGSSYGFPIKCTK